MRNLTYNLNDYSEALWIASTQDQLNHGEYMEIWASKVIRFFKRLYAIARKFVKSTRHFGLALKAVYRELRYRTLNNLFRTYMDQVATSYRPIDLYSAKGEKADLGLKMKIRKTKYSRRP